MRIALFTHNFIEPTHYAIASVLARLTEYRYTVFAKRFLQSGADVPTVVERVTYTKGPIPCLDSNNFDLVHAIFDGKTALRAAENAHVARLPFVLSFHGGFDIKAKVFDPRYMLGTRLATESAAAVTVPCESDEARLRCLGVRRPIAILPVPVDPAILPAARERDPQRLICVARLIPKKGVDVALHTLRRLPRHSLEIVGDGPLRSTLEALADQLGISQRVRFVGALPLPATLDAMAGASVLLHPARVAADGNAEGTPQTILWAQAMGLPVLTTPTGSIPDVVRNGENGLLVPSNNVDALIRAIWRLDTVPGLRESIINAGLCVLPTHRLDRVVEMLRDIYRKACATRRK